MKYADDSGLLDIITNIPFHLVNSPPKPFVRDAGMRQRIVKISLARTAPSLPGDDVVLISIGLEVRLCNATGGVLLEIDLGQVDGLHCSKITMNDMSSNITPTLGLPALSRNATRRERGKIGVRGQCMRNW